MKKPSPLALVVMFSIASSTASACSCGKSEIAEALEESTDVFVARVVSTSQVPAPEDSSGKYIIERAFFEVIESIKGSKKAGDKVQIRSEIGPGPCGRSARNAPMWLEEAQSPPSDVPKAFPISDTWLIFGRDKEPYELSLCSRSSPLNVGGGEDLESLRQLIKSSERQHEP